MRAAQPLPHSCHHIFRWSDSSRGSIWGWLQFRPPSYIRLDLACWGPCLPIQNLTLNWLTGEKKKCAREHCGRHIITVHSLHSHWQISPALDSQPPKPISEDAASNWLNSVGVSFLRIFPHQHQPQTCRSSWISKSSEYLGAWMRIIM